MPTFLHKKIYLGGMAFAVPPRYIIEPEMISPRLSHDCESRGFCIVSIHIRWVADVYLVISKLWENF